LQTVLPGSVHVSGEPITFQPGHDAAPTPVTPAELVRAVHKVAAGALLCRYWPAFGRHDAMLALAGALARAQWSREDARAFCHALYEAVPTHDPNALSRVDSEVNDSFDKVEAGEPATGFPSLTEHIDPKVVKAAFEWLGITGHAANGEKWRESLIRSETGTIKALLANVLLTLRNDPKWQGLLGYNEFALTTVLQRPTPWQSKTGAVWTDFDDSQLAAQLQRDGITVNTRIAAEAAATIAQESPFHPVRTYLQSCAWDGKERAGSWLSVYFGAEENDYTHAVGRCWLISAVARVMCPGIQADHLLLLLGAQGSGKSSGLRALFGTDFFSDRLSPLGSKDSYVELQGVWCVELSELSAMRRSEIEATKSFLTARVDHVRLPYARRAQALPRQCVFCGTSNDQSPFSDPTGSRRFWPVRTGKIDVAGVANMRDQLWAEALSLYEAGEKWWFESPELTKAAAREADEHYAPGVLEEEILNWCEHPKERSKRDDDHAPGPLPFDSQPYRVTITDVLLHCIGKPYEKMAYADVMQVQRCLVHNGWRRLPQSRIPGTDRRVRFYALPTPASRGSL
jgi:predicted P-loop ATPase